MAADGIEIMLVMHAQTERAVLLSETGDEARAKWVPRSQITRSEHTGKRVCGRNGRGSRAHFPLVEVLLPAWLARQLEFV